MLPASREVLRGYLDLSVAAPDELTTIASNVGRVIAIARAAQKAGRRMLGDVLLEQGALDAEVAAGRLRPLAAEHLIISLMSLIIFPHVAVPMLQAVLGLSEAQRADLLEWRRHALVDFLLRGFTPEG